MVDIIARFMIKHVILAKKVCKIVINLKKLPSIEELIAEFERIKSLGYVPTVVDNGINGGGLTLEKLLGKEIDNLYTPDYKGIELKSDNEKFYINIYDKNKNLLEQRGYIYFDDLIKRCVFKLSDMCLIRYSKKVIKNVMHYRYYQMTYYKLQEDKLIKLIKENKLRLFIHLYFYKVNGIFENRSKNIELQLKEEAIPDLFEKIKEIN